MGKRVLVCGGRNFADQEAVYASLAEAQPDLVIHGGAGGADSFAARWCNLNGIPSMVFRPCWEKFKLAAGPIRNGWMLTFGQPDVVLAFPGGRGTADMVRQAEQAGVPVRRWDWGELDEVSNG